MNSLVIYDSNGRIYSIIYGATEEDVPIGLRSMWVIIPDGTILRNIDVSDPDEPKPVFDTYLNVNLTDIRNDITRVDNELKQIVGDQPGQIGFLEKAMAFAAVTFTDEQALQVPDLYPEWSGAGVSYTAGERVRFVGTLYKVLQNHTSQEEWTPDTAHSLFVKILIPDPEVIPNWEQPESTNGYAKGDKVRHKEKVWESLVDNNVWEPGVVGTEGQWKEVE